MKVSKKAIPVVAFALGACVFVSTALADMALGTGYDRLKDATKHTAAQLESGTNNFTLQTSYTLKDNDRILLHSSTVNKIDMVKQASEETSSTQNGAGEPTTTRYSYTDRERSIWKYDTEEKYYVMDYPEEYLQEQSSYKNPFNQRGAAEFERIVDALVGNLKDQVQVEESTNGAVTYSGSLTEAQVPAVVNAVASFGVMQLVNEQGYRGENQRLPELTSDVFVKKVTGTAVESETGLLEQATGEVILSGKDASGAVHDMTMSVIVSLTDVGTTSVEAPDLRNAAFEKVGKSGITEMYVGTYRNDIVMEKDGKFLKIGERTLEITGVDGDKVSGKYSETVKPGFESEYGEPYDFTFEYEPDGSKPMSFFTYANAQGEQEYGQLSPGGAGKLYLNLQIEIIDDSSYRSNDKPHFNGEFNRVFEE
ncbi:hypothetical protein FE782_27260 [Paenibacillus antri]|uniref:DUF4179 domain-containing protein n=1 Tax=Paenibacillus antri TaxID=2582848 RepID=A0A5R9G051_9BACL|nr:hypothetical protein [Paenibacillus antri]TLS49141.1 hypothetical protein FE782_27260 [Paenibacillus antri]